MATNNPLENQITCSVCLDVYKDPYLLIGCLHTFCRDCIVQLEKKDQIECPECRHVSMKKDIRKDFKIQGFIDIIHDKQQVNNETTSSAECGMCCSLDKPVRYHCIECNHYLCEGCQETHSAMDANKNHEIKTLSDINTYFEMHFQELADEFELEQRTIGEKASQVDKEILVIEKCEKQQLEKVQHFTEDAVKELKENEQRLKKMIKDANASLIKNLKESKEIFSKSQADIQNKIDCLKVLTKSQDLSTLMESAENIKDSLKMSMEAIKSSLPDRAVLSMLTFTITVKKAEQWNIKDFIEVNISELPSEIKAVKPLSRSSYSEICQCEFVQKESAPLDYYPLKLFERNHEIWCLGEEIISVFNKNCQKIQEISGKPLKSTRRDFTLTHTNHIIVACGNGLHQLDISGKYQTRIAKGSFSNVCTYGEHLYALDCNNRKILVFEYVDKWINARKVVLHYKNGSAYDKFCIREVGIYVSSVKDKCIYCYNLDGQLLKEIKQDNLELHICGVDAKGNFLVAEYDNNQIQVYDREGRWNAIPLPGFGDLDLKAHALIDDSDNLWVANYGNNTIVKFMKK